MVVMAAVEATCWTLVRGAAGGAPEERERFAWRYAPLVEAYLRARWQGEPLLPHVPDVVQEVFLECLRQGGALSRVEEDRPGGFRAFLYGVIRNVARRSERKTTRSREQQAPESGILDGLPDDEAGLSGVFERAWARQIMQEAAEEQQRRARTLGDDALRRVTLLQERFGGGQPIRAIAERWNEDPAHLHHEYAKAREEFHQALRAVVAFYLPGTAAEIDEECARLGEMLS